jgi:hypothetical protein
LHCHKKDSDKQERNLRTLSRSLKDAKHLAPILLTNYKKDGTSFVNLLATKPIFDQNHSYRYVIGLHCRLPFSHLDEITDEVRDNILEDSSPSQLKLLKIIPDQIYV